MTTTDRPQPQVWHTLRYHDAPAAIEFLTSVLGFELTVRYDGADPSVVEHAQLRGPEGDSGIMLGTARESPEWPALAGHGAAYVSTGRVEEIWARVQDAAGFTITQELHDDDYGPDVVSRSFAVRDPEGNLWSVGGYRGEPWRG
jgi:uncharacterized glyoxalase superfamily protein PhnB